MKSLLNSIFNSIHEKIRIEIGKSHYSSAIKLKPLSQELQKLIDKNHPMIKSTLFNNDDDIFYYAQDILCETFRDHVFTNEDIEEVFKENRDRTGFRLGIKKNW
jgi:hypothetical protein